MSYKPNGIIKMMDIEFKTMPTVAELRDFIIKEGGLNVVNSLNHKFIPQGETDITIIEESHLAIHTYPEHLFAAVDLYTCGCRDFIPGVENLLKKQFKIKKIILNEYKRGIL